MSRINGSSCLDQGNGIPQRDAAYQHLKSNASIATSKVAACELTGAIVVASDLAANTGSFVDLVADNLTVNNLTVTNCTGCGSGGSGFVPSYIILEPLAATYGNAVLGGAPALYVNGGYPANYDFEQGLSPTRDCTVSWTLNVPASNTRYISFEYTSSNGPTTDLKITVNGVDVANGTGPVLIQNPDPIKYPNQYTCAPFVWAGGIMNIIFTTLINKVALRSADPTILIL